MKIAILTLHFSKNYGAVLQAFALLSAIKSMGHDAFIIDRHPDCNSFLHRMEYRYSPFIKVAWFKFDRFAKERLQPKTKKYMSAKSLQAFDKEGFDAVIVGSDQVWRFRIAGLNYFLDFVKEPKTKKFAYAASFGKAKWEETDYAKDTEQVAELLRAFNAISVREEEGVAICNNTFHVDAQCVVDPTLLFDRSFYENKLLAKEDKRSNKNLISYLLGDNKPQNRSACTQLAKQNNLVYKDLLTARSAFVHLSVECWLNEIRNAKYVVTNSFHGMIFAILFGKQFLVVKSDAGGNSRIHSLTSKLGLQERYVDSIQEVTIARLAQPIDYEGVYERLNELRRGSKGFLDTLFGK